MKLEFLKSAASSEGWPQDSWDEVLFVGRSNAGKSSLINALAQRKLAKVSRVPGKTTLLNFFNTDKRFRIVDSPGYGFAKRSGKEVLRWRAMMESYVNNRQNLKGFVLVMDVRREWSEDEQSLFDLSKNGGHFFHVVLTKCDKISKNKYLNISRKLQKQLDTEVYITDSRTGLGVSALRGSVVSYALTKS